MGWRGPSRQDPWPRRFAVPRNERRLDPRLGLRGAPRTRRRHVHHTEIEEGCMPDDAIIVSLRSDRAETPAAKREAPQRQPERPAVMPSPSEKAAGSQRRPWIRRALFALLPLALGAGCY